MDINEMKINVSVDTDVLSLKLKAFAKHAEALANELDMIDSDKCNMCDSMYILKGSLTGDTIVEEWIECLACGWSSQL